MTNLPDDHFAWSYMNPTRYHLGNQTPYEDLIEREEQHERDFQNWFDGILFVHQELKEKTNDLHPSPDKQSIQTETIEENNSELKTQEEQGSSSVEDKPSRTISWGERKTADHEESLRLWMQTNKPKAEKKSEKEDETNLEEMTLCSVCDQEMSKIRPGINTCQECQQCVNECKEINTQNNEDCETKHQKERMSKAQNDDETEFDRIPIAGENESDYEDSDDIEEEEDSILPYL